MGQGQSHHDVSVVIVGGGYAGTNLAILIQKSCNVTVIDPSPVLYHSIASLRNAVFDNWTGMTMWSREGNWPAINQIRGWVTGFNKEEKTVHVAGRDEPVKYDYLVLATGSQVPFPGKVPLKLLEKGPEEVAQVFKACFEKVQAAEHIAIVGAGAVGLELAGEIVVEMPEKKVTVIHAKDQVLDENLPDNFRAIAFKKYSQYGVNFVLGTKVDLSEIAMGHDVTTVAGPTTLKTDNGQSINADAVFVCIGVKINKSAYENSLSAEQMAGDGAVKVNEFLQVEGEENIFAIGDCNNVPTPKMYVHGTNEAKVISFTGMLEVFFFSLNFIFFHPLSVGQTIKRGYTGSGRETKI